ncbi:MAG: hypothetical protein E7375_00655 [Clostridiales bacterium]|nr:hypothetical protein [Clostridiales bacterium]
MSEELRTMTLDYSQDLEEYYKSYRQTLETSVGIGLEYFKALSSISKSETEDLETCFRYIEIMGKLCASADNFRNQIDPERFATNGKSPLKKLQEKGVSIQVPDIEACKKNFDEIAKLKNSDPKRYASELLRSATLYANSLEFIVARNLELAKRYGIPCADQIKSDDSVKQIKAHVVQTRKQKGIKDRTVG